VAMGDPTGEADRGALRLDFDRRLLLRFRGLEETQSYYRLFMAPGMGHCRGGPGLNEFGRNGGSGPASSDMFTALEEWVEQGKAPAQITAWNCTNQVDITATTCTLAQGTFNRPLCPYPQKAVYTGTGKHERRSKLHLP
jgi:feruloyl esterase